MDFSSANLALVAYALVSGADGSLVENSGFAASTKLTTGVSILYLSTALAQEAVTGVYRDILVVTPGKSNGSLNSKSLAVANTSSTAIQVVFSSSENTDFSILVLRTVLPPVVPVATP